MFGHEIGTEVDTASNCVCSSPITVSIPTSPNRQILVRLASNYEKQQLAYRHCLNNLMCSVTPLAGAKLALQLYPLAVSPLLPVSPAVSADWLSVCTPWQ